MANLTRIQNNQITDSTIQGAKIAQGTLTGNLFASAITFNSNITIAGNLTLLGNTDTISATNTYINDPLVVFNNGYTGTPTYDIGVLMNRNLSTLSNYGLSGVNTALIWEETSQQFQVIATTETGATQGHINNSGFLDLQVAQIFATNGILTGTLSAGSFDSTPIGSNTPSTGAFTALSATSSSIGTEVATNFSTGNAVIKGGYINNLANVTAIRSTIVTMNATTGNITTLTGTSASYASLFAGNLSSPNVIISGGTIDSTVIGGTTAAAGSFTTLSASGSTTLTGTTDVTVPGSGTLVVSGGTNIAKSLLVGGNLTVGNIAASGKLTATGIYDSGIRVLSTTAGAGNLTLSGTQVTLSATGPGAATWGDASHSVQFNTDAYGRVVAAANVGITAPAANLTGTTLAAGVVNSSLTSVGTLTSLTVSGTIYAQNDIVGSTLNVPTINAQTVDAPIIGNTGTLLTGTLTTASNVQSNINVVGTLNSLTVTGNTALNNTVFGRGIYDQSNRVISTSTGTGNLTLSGASISLASTGPGAGIYGDASDIPVLTLDAYGRVQGVTATQVAAPAGSITGTTLAPTVVNSSLQTVGTLSALNVGGNTNVTNTLTATNVKAGTIGNIGALVQGSQLAFSGGTITGDLTVTGNLFVSNLQNTSSATISVNSPILYLTSTTPYPYHFDIGIFSEFSLDGVHPNYTGFGRNHATNQWTFFSNINVEPAGGLIDFTNPNTILDEVLAGSFVVANSTPAVSTSTGALQVAGGVGIGSTLYVGDYVSFNDMMYQSISTIDAAGTANVTATQITTQIAVVNNVPYVGTGDERVAGGVRLPVPDYAGQVVYVDAGSNATYGVNLYPDEGGSIDEADPDAPVLLELSAYWIGVAETVNPTSWASFVGQFVGNTNQISVEYGNGGAYVALANPLVTPGDTTIGLIDTLDSGDMSGTGNLVVTGQMYQSITTADAVGIDQASATGIDTMIFVTNNVDYALNGTPGGIRLPKPTYPGQVVYVDAGSNATNGVNLYPDVGGVIDAAPPNGPVLLANHAYWIGVCESINPSSWASFVGQFTGNTNQLTVAYGNGGAFIGLTDPMITPGAVQITSGTIAYGDVQIESTTHATSTTTGALTVDGGVGIAGNLFIGQNLVSQGYLYQGINTINAEGTTNTTATPITTAITLINDVSYDSSGNPGGVRLPTPQFPGEVVYLDVGDSAITGVYLYPDSGGQIDNADPDAGVLLANEAYWIGVCESINPSSWASFVGQFTGNTNQLTVAYGNGGAFIALTDPLITPGDTTITGNATITTNAQVEGILYQSINNVAGNGSTQTDATLITTQITAVTSGALNSGLRLPKPQYAGQIVYVEVTAGAPYGVYLYPDVGGTIDNAATNAGVLLPKNSSWIGVADSLSPTSWSSLNVPFVGNTNQISVLYGNGGAFVGLANPVVTPGGATISGTTVSTGNIVAAATTTSTNTTTGSFVAKGGVGIAGNAFIGGIASVAGNLVAAAATTSTNINTGAAVVKGGLGLTGNLYMAGNLVVGTAFNYAASSNSAAQFGVNANGRGKFLLQNQNNATLASTEYVAVADNGNTNTGNSYVLLGVNNSGFAATGLAYANDGHLTVVGNTITGGGNLLLSTSTANDIIFATNGQNANDEVMRITSGNTVILKGGVSNAQLQANTGTFQVWGGASISGNVYFGAGAVFNPNQVAGDNVTIKGAVDPSLFATYTNSVYDQVVLGGNILVLASDSTTDSTQNAIVPGAKVIVNSVDSMILPVGSTAQRPSGLGFTDTIGMFRYNSTLGYIEYYNGTQWIGQTQTFTVATDSQFNGDGATLRWTLPTGTSTTTAGTIVSINGIIQIPSLAYTIDAATGEVVFTEAPAVGDIVDVRSITTTSVVTGIQSGWMSITVDGTGIDLTTGNTSSTSYNTTSWDTTGAQISKIANVYTYASGVQTAVDTFDVNAYRTAKYIVQATNGGVYQSMEALVTHDSANAYCSTYAITSTGANLGAVTATVNPIIVSGFVVGGNVQLNFTANVNGAVSIRIKKDYLIV